MTSDRRLLLGLVAGWPLMPMHPDARMTMMTWVAMEGARATGMGFVPGRLRPDGQVQSVGPDGDEGRDVVRRRQEQATHIAELDWHTGLGDCGGIFRSSPDGPAPRRTNSAANGRAVRRSNAAERAGRSGASIRRHPTSAASHTWDRPKKRLGRDWPAAWSSSAAGHWPRLRKSAFSTTGYCSTRPGSKRWIQAVGTAWNDSSLGVATLALIVEHANPQRLSFPEFVQRELMDPLGMTLSQYPPAQHEDHVRPDIRALASTGYSRMGQVHVPTFSLCLGEYLAGGVMARPADPVRLLLAMMNGGELDGHRIIREATARAMLTPATVLVRTPVELAVMGVMPFEQGLMWRLNDVGKPDACFDHGGGHLWGWRKQGRAWPQQRVGVMTAVNQWTVPDDSPVVQEVLDFIGTRLMHCPTVDADAPSPVAAGPMSYARGVLLALL